MIIVVKFEINLKVSIEITSVHFVEKITQALKQNKLKYLVKQYQDHHLH